MSMRKEFKHYREARVLRRDMTEAEERLWIYLSNKGMVGYKFRRQYPVSKFVLDFYCPQKKLAIEIDGPIHLKLQDYDKARQDMVERRGIEFLRFKNEEVLENIDNVLKTIKRKLATSKMKESNK